METLVLSVQLDIYQSRVRALSVYKYMNFDTILLYSKADSTNFILNDDKDDRFLGFVIRSLKTLTLLY